MGLTIEDLDKLPDDVEIKLADGVAYRLGDIREVVKKQGESVVNKRISDLTPREQRVADRERQVEADAIKVREALVALANQPAPPTAVTPTNTITEEIPFGYTPEQWAVMKSDPIMRPILMGMSVMASKVTDLERGIKERDEKLATTEAQRRSQEEANYMKYQMTQLAQKYPDIYATEEGRNRLWAYAQEMLNKRDLTAVHRAFRYDDDIKSAEERGYQKGVKEQSVRPAPVIPHGTRAAPVSPQAEKLPATFAEFVDSAANDESFIDEVRQAALTPPPPQQQ